MIPGVYDIEIYQGDTYYGPKITLPDLSPFGGPSNLTSASVTAQFRTSKTASEGTDFGVEILDATLREVRLTLTPSQTAALTRDGVWDLSVSDGAWKGTVLAGKVTLYKQVTRE